MKRSVVKFVKVQWSNHSEDEATWEREDRLRQEYPEFFSDEYVFSLPHHNFWMKFIILDIIYVDTITITEALGMSHHYINPAFVHHLLDVYLA